LSQKIELLIQPGGLTTAAGGTRTTIKLNRPWQTDIVVDPKTCPFCAGRQKQKIVREVGEWLELENLHTPLPYHHLIIPNECWPKEMVRNLGGREKLREALKLIDEIVTRENREQMLYTIYSGYLAGQNVAHLHHHIFDNTFPGFTAKDVSDDIRKLGERPELFITSRNSTKVIAGGLRAGQCFLVLDFPEWTKTAAGTTDLILEVIELYAEKFRSEQGLPPDFQLALRFRKGQLVFGMFIPILNNWGATEFLGLMGEQPLILPWSHETTARYLRGELDEGAN